MRPNRKMFAAELHFAFSAFTHRANGAGEVIDEALVANVAREFAHVTGRAGPESRGGQHKAAPPTSTPTAHTLRIRLRPHMTFFNFGSAIFAVTVDTVAIGIAFVVDVIGGGLNSTLHVVGH